MNTESVTSNISPSTQEQAPRDKLTWQAPVLGRIDIKLTLSGVGYISDGGVSNSIVTGT